MSSYPGQPSREAGVVSWVWLLDDFDFDSALDLNDPASDNVLKDVMSLRAGIKP